jgi:hypothetical protein
MMCSSALESGVGLCPIGIDDWMDSISISSGTQLVAGLQQNLRAKYEPDAVLPNEDWRRPTSEEFLKLVDEKLFDRVDAVTILRFPIRQAGASESSSFRIPPNKNDTFGVRIFAASDTDLVKRVSMYCQTVLGATAENGFSGGLHVNAPGLLTTTRSGASGPHVGLHVDNWTKLPIHGRYGCENRICVNIGSESRYFLFVNLTIDRMFDSMAVKCKGHGTAVARQFFNNHPTYPVFRVRLRPGEAYIAPTELLAHDASSIEMTDNDVSIMLRGMFPTANKLRGLIREI